jgi:hypothetical protein
MEKVVLGQVFSEHFYFPYQFHFHHCSVIITHRIIQRYVVSILTASLNNQQKKRDNFATTCSYLQKINFKIIKISKIYKTGAPRKYAYPVNNTSSHFCFSYQLSYANASVSVRRPQEDPVTGSWSCLLHATNSHQFLLTMPFNLNIIKRVAAVIIMAGGRRQNRA